MNNQKRRYDNLDLLKAVAILLVITLHLPLWRTDFITDPRLSIVIQFAFRIVSEGVPFFVTINGFLLLQKDTLDLKQHFNKCLKLFYLMIIWAIILTVAGTALTGSINDITLVYLLHNIFDIRVGAPLTGVLWFLQNLLGVYLVFPVLWKVYKDDFKLFQYFFGVAFLLIVGINCLELLRDIISLYKDTTVLNEMISFLRRFNSIGNEWYIFYFCLGGMIYHYYEQIKKYRRTLLVAGVLSWPAAFIIGYHMSVGRQALYNDGFNYGTIMMVFLILGAFALTLPFNKESGVLSKLICNFGQKTLGIYFVHFVFIWIIRKKLPYEDIKTRLFSYSFVIAASFLFAELCSRNRILKKLTML